MPRAAKEIILISADDKLNWKITRQLVEQDYTISTHATINEGLSMVYESPPALIMIHEGLLKGKGLQLLKKFKKDNLFSHIPVVILAAPEWEKKAIDWDKYQVEDYLITSCKPEELHNRVALCMNRFYRTLDPNPLTRLPGNTSILREIQRLLDLRHEIVIAYLDIDNFKAFNDKYGFARGDEALRMTARILSNVIMEYENRNAFVGHVGGDDFVYIVPEQCLAECCKKVIASFDAIIPSLYDEQDRKKGAIISTDRAGKKQRFPLMTVSIACVSNKHNTLKHYGEVSQIASQVKKKAKKEAKSNYLVDQRK
ncbi:MAG: diguanylate cyclase [Deltaproteobacteria bacterium]|nr:diguanylate cyclase [Deltaproteobacteria bacterium]